MNSSRGRNGPGCKRPMGLSFRAQRQMQPDFMYAAVASGEVDVIAGYTSDGLIAKYDLVVLDDPRHAIPPYDAIVLLAPKRADDQALRAALQPLLGKIDIATMREANLRAAGNDATSSPDAVARWLWEKIGKKSQSGCHRSRRWRWRRTSATYERVVRSTRVTRTNYSPLIMPASISSRLKRRASAPSLQS